MCVTSFQSHANVHNIWFICQKLQHDIIHWQIICKILDWCITFIMSMNANASFTWFCWKVTSHVCLFIFDLLATTTFNYLEWVNILCYNPTFFKTCPHSTTMCKFSWCLIKWLGICWHLDIHIGKLTFLLNIDCVFFVYHLFLVFSH
jgi:hypothetical protein